jgi:hypothetical protein
VVVLVVGSVALGVIRPRWTTLLAALVPTALAFAWLVVGATCALAIAAGVAADRRAGRSPRPRAVGGHR